jgi:hypothetical protein
MTPGLWDNVLENNVLWSNCEESRPIAPLIRAFAVAHLLGEEIMSYGALIYSHVYNPPIAAEVLCGISRGQGRRPGIIVNFVPSQLEIETQLVMDRLLRECFTRRITRPTRCSAPQ